MRPAPNGRPTLPGVVRAALQEAVRSRVAGPDAASRAQAIWADDGERRFGPADPIWTVHEDAAIFVGGLRALLLQSLHPVAMRAVDEHSTYRTDPWGRLQRTAHFVAVTTFGPTSEADAAIRRVRRIHDAVRGVTPSGRPYRASDPHLLGWVHVAEVDSFLTTHQRFGQRPLKPADVDRYLAQSAVIAGELGVVDPPRTRRELAERWRAYRPELRSSRAARTAARFLVLRPPVPVLATPAYSALALAAVTSLPGWARRQLGLWTPPVSGVVAGRTAGAGVTAALRWVMADG